MVIATDAQGLTGADTVTVTFADANEAAPEFAAAGMGKVDENGGAGQVVYTPEAAVPDVDADAVAYRLSGADAGDFTIVSGTGALTLTGNPDHEAKSGYSVVITAVTREGETDERAAAQAVMIGVVDLNDEAPAFAPTGTAAVDENSGAGQVVYTPVAAVPDVDVDAVAYRLSGTDASDFMIDSGTGALTLTGNPDFDAKSGYSVVITAVTRAGEADERSAAQAVTVEVADIDDVALTRAGTQAALSEGAFGSETATGYSYDVPGGQGLTFAVSDARFLVDALGALAITPGASFDHEAGDGSVSLVVTVTDDGGRTASDAVTVVFADVNDEAPAFAATGAGGIDENSGAGQVVYTPVAAVPDVSGDSVAYRLSGTDAADFTIDSGTGALTLTGDPDHEAKSGYSVVVTAVTREGETDERSTAQSVAVTVADLNDGAPAFAASGTAGVIDGSGAGQVVYFPEAAVPDVDGDSAAYRLSGTDAGDFTIDPNTGALTLTGDPDHAAKSGYSVVVTAVTREGETDEQSADPGGDGRRRAAGAARADGDAGRARRGRVRRRDGDGVRLRGLGQPGGSDLFGGRRAVRGGRLGGRW